jgi:hypothetical protein
MIIKSNNKFISKLSLIALMVLFMAENTLAYRPFGTEDAGVAGKNVFQTEISFDYLKWSDNKLERNLLFVPIYGLTDNLELSVEIPYLFHQPPIGVSYNGFGDISLVLKGLMLNEGKNFPALTAKGVVKADNGDFNLGLGSGDKDYSLFAAATKTAGKFVFHGQIGYSWIGKGKTSILRDITLFGLAVDFSVSDKLHLLAELNGNRHPDSAATGDPSAWLLGINYKLSDKIIFDAAGKWGLSSVSPNWNLTTGISATI